MKFFVTGATGTVGRNIVAQLVAAGHTVRALTRHSANASFPAGVEVIQGDLAVPSTFATALEGVDGIHLIAFAGDDYGPLASTPEILALAEAAGVRRVTLLMGGDTQAVEEAVKASALEWTLLQPVEFMSNMLHWVEPAQSGVIREGFGTRRTAIVHEADIAAVAVTALMQAGHGGKTYTITGPEVLTPPQMVQAIAEASGGSPLRFEELTVEAACDRWRAEGFPEEVIQYFIWMYGNTPEIGKTVAPTVEQVTGHPARTFAQWAAEYADAFRVPLPAQT